MTNQNITELLDIIDTLPPELKLSEWSKLGGGDVIGYHITYTHNIDDIRKQGLVAHEVSMKCRRRPYAVYLFLDDLDERNVPILVGDVTEYAVIKVKIPRENISNLYYDGLYNMSFDCGYGAAMYLGDIPESWIIEVTKCEK